MLKANSTPNKKPLKILLVRRDNIGDLVCTTPLFSALRAHFPDAHIAALVNSYNRSAVIDNPDLDAVYAYTKGKHVENESVIAAHWRRLALMLKLRREKFDYVILASGGYAHRMIAQMRFIRPKHIIGFVTDEAQKRKIDLPVVYGAPTGVHESEDIFRLLSPLGIVDKKPPAMTVVAEAAVAEQIAARLPRPIRSGDGPLIGLHISSRKPPQRWPIDRFASLAEALHQKYGARFLLFWSPGDEHNPFHPGDDGKAEQLLQQMKSLPVAAVRTEQLAELIAGLSLLDMIVLSDGGALHLAAGLGKPMVCFFGNSDASRWYPWGVPHRLIQKPSRTVMDISPQDAIEAFAELFTEVRQPS